MNIRTLSSSTYKPSVQKPTPFRQVKPTVQFGTASAASSTPGSEPKPPASKWQKGLKAVKANLPYSIGGTALFGLAMAILMPPMLILTPLTLVSWLFLDFLKGTKDPD